MNEYSADTLIVGAGAAGLAAGAELAAAGPPVLVLEARDRVGGRIWTRQEIGSPLPIELGAEFIHGPSPATFALLRRAGAVAVDAEGPHWVARGDALEPGGDLFSAVQQALRRSHALEDGDLSFAALLERIPREELTEAARAFARSLVEGFDAADPAWISGRSIVQEWCESDALDAPQFRPLGGYGPLLRVLQGAIEAAGGSIKLESVVHTVRWARHFVEIEGSHRTQPFRARAPRAILTLPIGILRQPPDAAGAIRFDPPLVDKRDAIDALASGAVIKIVMRFHTAFWERLDGGRYHEALFFHCADARFPTFWTTLPMRAPMLVAWTGGLKAGDLASGGREAIIDEAIRSLETLFGKRLNIADQLEAAYVHDWQQDPFSRGAYSYVRTGGEHARRALAMPLEDTLFFAGEAADVSGEAGTVAGALESGTRAARELMCSDSRSRGR